MTEGSDGGDAMARLEQRVATLETLVRRLVASGAPPVGAAVIAPPPPQPRPEPTRAEAAPPSTRRSGSPRARTAHRETEG